MRFMRTGGVLSEAEIERVIDQALLLLHRVGVKVENEWILAQLERAGARVSGGAARFDPEWTRQFLKDTERVDWSDAPVAFSGCAEIYQGWYLDPEDGARKPWTMERLLRYAALATSLSEVGAASLLGMPAVDGPEGPQPLTEKLVCWKWGLSGGCAIWDTQLCPAIFEMYSSYARALGQDPRALFSGTVYLISPLKFAKEEAAQYEFFARRGWEVSVGSLGSLGGTTPVTPAGALSLQLAEGLFLGALRRTVFGARRLSLYNSLSVIDMSTGAFQYGRPEQGLLNLAGAQLAQYLGAEYSGHGGLTDAREPGYQSAFQKVVSCLINARASGRGHLACGLLAVDELFSPEQLVLDAEALGYLNRLARGVEVDAEALALEAIVEAGWGGQFLGLEHTCEHFRESLWFPKLFSTQSLGMWARGRAQSDQALVRSRALELMGKAPALTSRISEDLEHELLELIRRPLP